MKPGELMINPIRNKKGIALVGTILMVVLGFGIVAILFRLSTQEAKLAGLEQGYTAALDAAKSGADLFIYMVQNATPNPPVPSGSGSTSPFGTSYLSGQCLNIKMYNSTANWSSNSGWSGCPSATSATAPSAISTNPADSPDITLSLVNGAINYTVYVKLIDNYMSQATGAARARTAVITIRSCRALSLKVPTNTPRFSSSTATANSCANSVPFPGKPQFSGCRTRVLPDAVPSLATLVHAPYSSF